MPVKHRPALVPGKLVCFLLALVAQRIEHLTTDQKVGSSNLSERATNNQFKSGFT